MNSFDWLLVLVYLTGMVLLAVRLGRGQKNSEDYYLGGRKMRWWAIGLSTMATQCSTNSLLGAPAFVAFASLGGLVWLQYELAVPLAMIVLMVFLLPMFRKSKVISIYAYLEQRFGVETRTAVSIVFQFTRAFSTGVTVFGISLVLQKLIGVPFWAAVLILGVVTVIYDSIGGMAAVVYSDVIQMCVLYGGIVLAIIYAVNLVGGLDAVWANFDPARRQALDTSSWGFGAESDFTLWPMLLGGLFLYASYYGCDQTQVQRELSASNEDQTNMSLALNGFCRFPLVVTYCFLGVCIAAFAKLHPEFITAMPLKASGSPEYNMAVPMFVLHYLPHGVIGLIMISLFSAAMSSLDSTINSLSALTMRDIYRRFLRPQMSKRHELIGSKLLTVFWGIVCCSFAFFVGSISDTIIESINKIGSLINGPLLAVFLMGMLTRRATNKGALSGLGAGFLFNCYLWLAHSSGPYKISWWWWNVFGFAVCWGVGMLVSYLGTAPPLSRIKEYVASGFTVPGVHYRRNWRPVYWALGIWCLVMICILALF
jgi:SSS family transporter